MRLLDKSVNSMAVLQPAAVSAANRAANGGAPVISVRDLMVVYDGETAIEHISFDIHAGERIAIIGPNGAGKSTLLKAIVGLIQPRGGTIEIAPEWQDHLGYVPQYENIHWNFPVTVRDVVMMGCARRIGWLRWPRREHWQTVEAALERVGLADLSYRQVGDLSGGQRRRVFIARALAQDARILVLDEPFSGVDASAQTDLMGVLERLNAEGMTLLLSTHDLDLAFHRFSRVMALRQTLIAYGKPDEVYTTDVLTAIYGRRLIAWHDGKPIDVFVDEHACPDC